MKLLISHTNNGTTRITCRSFYAPSTKDVEDEHRMRGYP
jgi:hypothetical protein